MAVRRLTPEEEDELVRDIEEHRDDESRWDYAHPLRRAGHTDADITLSVTLSPAEFRELVRIALDRDVEPPDMAAVLLKELLRGGIASPK